MKNTVLVSICLFAVLVSMPLPADTITQHVGGNVVSDTGYWWGVTFQTPTGGPWDKLTFNFYGETTITPDAAGTLYLLSQPFTGVPNALSSTAPGFIASTSTIVGGEWVFNSSLTVQPGTQYYLFADQQMVIEGGGTDVATTRNYFTTDPNTTYLVSSPGSGQPDFLFAGTVVPEPSLLRLTALGLASGLVRLRRRHG